MCDFQHTHPSHIGIYISSMRFDINGWLWVEQYAQQTTNLTSIGSNNDFDTMLKSELLS